MSVPVTDEHHLLSAKYAALVGKPQRFISSYEEAITQSPSAKLLVLTHQPDELIAQAKATFSEGEFNIIRGSPDPFFVEFLPSGVSKGGALATLCEVLGVDLASEVVAFGDGDNDSEMLSMAAIGVAMANAKPKAKLSADLVIEVSTMRWLTALANSSSYSCCSSGPMKTTA